MATEQETKLAEQLARITNFSQDDITIKVHSDRRANFSVKVGQDKAELIAQSLQDAYLVTGESFKDVQFSTDKDIPGSVLFRGNPVALQGFLDAVENNSIAGAHLTGVSDIPSLVAGDMAINEFELADRNALTAEMARVKTQRSADKIGFEDNPIGENGEPTREYYKALADFDKQRFNNADTPTPLADVPHDIQAVQAEKATLLERKLEELGYDVPDYQSLGELQTFAREIVAERNATAAEVTGRINALQEDVDLLREELAAPAPLADVPDDIQLEQQQAALQTFDAPEVAEQAPNTAELLMEQLAAALTAEQSQTPLAAVPEDIRLAQEQAAQAKKIVVDLDNGAGTAIPEPEPFVTPDGAASVPVDTLKAAIDSGARFGKGSQGKEVIMELQTFLKEHDLYTGEIDGKFGPLTAGGLEVYQAEQGITKDGIAGPQTLTAIQQTNIVAALDLNGDAKLDVAEIKAAAENHNVVAANDGTYKIDDIEVTLNTPNETLARASSAERG